MMNIKSSYNHNGSFSINVERITCFAIAHIVIFILLISTNSVSQVPMNCNNDPPPAQTANEVVLQCEGLDALNEYCFTLQHTTCPVIPGNFPGCDSTIGQLDNPNWFGFVAGSDSITIQINVENCQNPYYPNGVQIGFYEATSDLDLIPECNATLLPLAPVVTSDLPVCGTCVEGLATFEDIPTTIGRTYYLVFDGCVGDICDIFITVVAGGQAPQIPDAIDILFPLAGFNPPNGTDPDTVCPGAQNYMISTPDILYSSSFLWTLPDGSLRITEDPELFFDFPNLPGSLFEFCVRGRNECDTSINSYCETIIMASLDTIVDAPIILCEGDSATWMGIPIGPFENLEMDSTFTLFFNDVDLPLFFCNRVHVTQVTIFAGTALRIDPNSIDTFCDLNINAYRITFIIENADPSNLIIEPPGVLVGSEFTSDFIASGTPYKFVVYNANGCGADSISGIHACSCQSSIGSLNAGVFNLCEDDTLIATSFYDPAGQVILGSDVRNYILSQSAIDPLTTIIRNNLNGQFGFNDSDLTFGTTYFISVLIGKQSQPDVVDIFDPCLLMTDMIAVTWYEKIDEFDILSSGIEIDCDQPIIDLAITTLQDTQGYVVIWSADQGGRVDSFNKNDHIFQVTIPGRYIVTIEHPLAGCAVSDTVSIGISPEVPEIILSTPDTLTCLVGETSVSGSGSTTGPDILYEWAGPGIIGDPSLLSILVGNGGTYVLTLTDTENNCTVVDSVVVVEDRVPPEAVASVVDKIDCQTFQVMVSGEASSVGFSYVYLWTALADSGNIISSVTQRDILVGAPGFYSLTVTNLDNGCMATAIVEVEVEENIIQTADILIDQPSCNGDFDGTIIVSNIIGGISPFSYSYNGGVTFSEDSILNDLAPGIYEVITRDASGCEIIDTAILTAPFDFFVDLGEDQMVALGEQVTLVAETNLPDSLLKSMAWSPLFDTLNQDATMQQFNPDVGNYTIAIAVTNLNGCQERDEINVFVRFEKRIYIPSAMRPSSNTLDNKYLNIYADPIVVSSIESFDIYNRWGGRVYQRQGIPVSLTLNSLYAWDGRVEGGEAEPGVYTYVVDVQYINGVRDILYGEFTLLK